MKKLVLNLLLIVKKKYFYFFKSGRKSVLANLVWLVVDKIGRQGLNFIITSYIARYLGVELFGTWNFAIAFVLLFSFFSTLGIYSQLIRDFVKYPEKKNDLLGSAFVIKMIGGCLTLVLSYLTIYLTKPESPLLHTLVLIVALGYIVQSFDVLDFFFQSQLKSRWTTLSRLISFFIFSILKLLLIHYQFPLYFFAWVQVGEFFVSGMIMTFFFNRNFGSVFEWRFDWVFAITMLKESMPILFAEVAILIYMRIDQVMIGEILGSRQLGIFSAAVRLSEIWYMVPGVICSALFPSIVKAYMTNQIDYKVKLQKLYDLLTWISLCIAICVSFLSQNIILVFYGYEFIGASNILTVHIWTSVFVFSGILSGNQLILENSSKINFYRTLFGVVSNVLFNFILIPIYGAVGAAFATLIGQALANWGSNYFFKSSKQIFWIQINSLNLKRIARDYL